MEINEVGGSSMENAFSSIRIWPTSEYEIQHCKHEAANGQLPPNLKTLIIADFNDCDINYCKLKVEKMDFATQTIAICGLMMDFATSITMIYQSVYRKFNVLAFYHIQICDWTYFH